MTSSPATMRSVRLSGPGPVGNLRLTTLPLPPERDGWVRIRVEAFGLNRSELPGQSVLIRGGTSSVGLAAAALAAWRGATVLSTTRRADRLAMLAERGVDHPLLDAGEVAPAVRELDPGGVDAALDLVGTPTLPDTLRTVRVHGTACFGGSLSNQYVVRDFSPNEYLPRGVRLAGYFGDAADLPRETFQEILDAVAAGPAGLPRGPRLRRPGAGAAGSRRHGARPRRRQARRPRPA